MCKMALKIDIIYYIRLYESILSNNDRKRGRGVGKGGGGTLKIEGMRGVVCCRRMGEEGGGVGMGIRKDEGGGIF